jgi:hypothetical protein
MFTLSVMTVFVVIGLAWSVVFKLAEQLAAGPQNNF